VSGGGAFEDRMGIRGISDAEAERLLGEGSNGGDPEARIGETAAFLRMARTGLLDQPPPEMEAELVARLAETARLRAASRVARPARPIFGSRRRLVAKLAVAMALVPAGLAGLAFAGVTLPGAADSAFDSLGINLPNQQDGDDADDGADGGASPAEPASEQPGSTKGTQSGQGKSDAAHQHALEQRRKAQGKALGHTRGKAIGLNDLEPPGQSGDTGPPAHSTTGGSARSESAPGKVKQTVPPRSRGRGKGLTK
jgi:hypothetical protein